MLCNHVSWLDTQILYKYYKVAFTLDIGFKKAPLMGSLGDIVDSIYLPRSSSDEKRQQALNQIRDRQDLIESTGEYTQLLIFAEGGTTNGTSLLTFKKGAFMAEKSVMPVIMKFNVNETSVNPAYDVIELLPLAILQLSWSCIQCDLIELPTF